MNGGQGDGGANGVQYDEIPYGDVGPGPSGKGQLPEVPVEYSQVPQIPQRQGTIRFFRKFTWLIISNVKLWNVFLFVWMYESCCKGMNDNLTIVHIVSLLNIK